MLRTGFSFILFLLLPMLVLRLFAKSMAVPGYRRRIGERFSCIQAPTWQPGRPTLWIHAVSVGEVAAAVPLVRELQKLNYNLAITTTTPTGSDRVRALFGQEVFHVYLPYDLGFLLRRFISKLQPELLIIMETELWPNLLRQCRRQGVGVILANARLSAKSARGYQRIAGLTRAMLHNIDHIAAQAQADAERFLQLGAAKTGVSVTGSLKFHAGAAQPAAPDSFFSSIRQSGRPVLIAASTRAGEEEKVVSAYQTIRQQRMDTLLLLVPRHPERFDRVESLCRDAGFTVQRRSGSHTLQANTQIVLGDSMGEMQAYYQAADIAFVGGSLVDTGCQNVLEPAALGLPVIVGPSQFNFATICQQLETAGALRTVPDSDGLAAAVLELLADEHSRRIMGEAGKSLVTENQQALPRLMEIIQRKLRERSQPGPV